MTQTQTKNSSKKQRRKRIPLSDQERMQLLTLMDDDFMKVFFDGEVGCVQEMLRIILKRDDLVVKSVKTQYHLQGHKRSVYLDIFAVDGKGRPINIELQNLSEGAAPRRARFNSAIIDTYSLEMGQDFTELPDHYVIFITREDVLGLGKMLYTVHRYIDGEEVLFDDGSHIIYVNMSAEDDGSDLWKLLQDLRCPDPNKMHFPNLTARMEFLKRTEEGLKKMEGILEDVRRKAAAEANAAKEAAEQKAAEAMKQLEKVERKAARQLELANKQAAKQLEQANKQAEQAAKQLELATKQAELATKQAAQATRRIEQAEEEKENFVLGLLKLGKLTMQEIADCSGLSVARIRKLAQSLA